METSWKPSADERNIALSRTPRDIPARRDQYAANMGSVGCPHDQLGNVGFELPSLDLASLNIDQNTLLIVGGALLAGIVVWTLSGDKPKRSRTAAAKARYISDYASQTGRLPRGV